VNFFFHNTLSPKLARSLDQLLQPEHNVRHLKHHFPANIEDQHWMRELAQKEDGRWVIITADVGMGTNRHKLEAWKEAGHTIFFFKPVWTDMSFWVQAQKFTTCFPDLIEAATKAPPGSTFLVSANGKIESIR